MIKNNSPCFVPNVCCPAVYSHVTELFYQGWCTVIAEEEYIQYEPESSNTELQQKIQDLTQMLAEATQREREMEQRIEELEQKLQQTAFEQEYLRSRELYRIV